MLSILIPNFNDDCQDLIHQLVKEIQNLNFDVEIIIGDDASTLESVYKSYNMLKLLPNVRILVNEQNLGREKTRVNLAKSAQYNFLLFFATFFESYRSLVIGDKTLCYCLLY